MQRDADYEIVRARTFEPLDRRGKVRAEMGCDPRGEPAARFYGDDQRTPNTEMSMDEGGSPQLWLKDGRGNVTASIFTGSPAISLAYTDQGSGESWAVGMSVVGEQGEPLAHSVSLAKDGRPRLIAGLADGVIPFILMRDEHGEVVSRQVGVPDD